MGKGLRLWHCRVCRHRIIRVHGYGWAHQDDLALDDCPCWEMGRRCEP